MSKLAKWNREANTDNDSRWVVYMMISRHKDNTEVKDFKVRCKSFFTNEDSTNSFVNEKVKKEFDKFVEDGLEGETCRLYRSVNARDTNLVRKKLIHYLIDHEDFDFNKMNGLISSIAAQKEAAVEKKWLFDFDEKSFEKMSEFLVDLDECGITIDDRITYMTPNGWHIITDHGFDTRELLEKWKGVVSMQRDGLRYVKEKKKESIHEN